MSMVFDRYPAGGGGMLLALAIADHANDDGGNIYPSIAFLAGKTRQSERTIQYQLRSMEANGWLVLINAGNGGRNQRRQYQISTDWIKGAEIAPVVKGATDDIKGADIAPLEVVKGATDGVKGAIHDSKGCSTLHPHITTIEPSRTIRGTARKRATTSIDVPDSLLADYMTVRKAKHAGPITETVVKGLQREADKAGISLTDAVTACCEFGWQGFNASWYADRKGVKGQANAPNETPYQRSQRLRFEKLTGYRRGTTVDVTATVLENPNESADRLD